VRLGVIKIRDALVVIKTPTKTTANEAQLGAITQFETIQNILWPLNQVV